MPCFTDLRASSLGCWSKLCFFLGLEILRLVWGGQKPCIRMAVTGHSKISALYIATDWVGSILSNQMLEADLQGREEELMGEKLEQSLSSNYSPIWGAKQQPGVRTCVLCPHWLWRNFVTMTEGVLHWGASSGHGAGSAWMICLCPLP